MTFYPYATMPKHQHRVLMYLSTTPEDAVILAERSANDDLFLMHNPKRPLGGFELTKWIEARN